ncbi:polyprenyl synthetase family protein [Agromyces intestinalis]|uniref:Polyprenyl synthetase family protein n=1 Tax=Agromyces intestinalis TaxID=2592652 RepID=A0A5C1YDP0_9MICO|nr:polyprenyl synthetase family protein [Agromyces intestinalis]QEO13199.1 polyprenyl synthetase family protein [Agromyces intestinalis]
MANGSRLVDLVQTRIEEFLADRGSILVDISPDLGAPLDFSRRFLSGGKRFRARFCHAGWRAAAGPADLDPAPVVAAAAALELFHAAALVHDDLIDNSDTRRGAPSAHRLFERLHADSGWNGDAAEYGRAAAILLGDLILGWSDELLDEALSLLDDRTAARLARAEFMRMRTEVAAGQYLDILEERAWSTRGEHAQRELAERVVVYKSAKYSIVAPLRIGAAIGGSAPIVADALADFGLPLGVAFQLRDDLLGVYGDPALTGKPAGDDLREGKRTLLVAIARERLGAGQRRILDELLGDPALTAGQVATLQQTIARCGAVDEVETIISAQLERAYAALDDAPVDDAAKAELRALGASVTRRSS